MTELPLRLAGAGLRVVVLGDAVLDGWLTGRSQRLSREAPVPVVDVDRRRFTPGAAANIAAQLAGLGARTTLLARVGDDAEGRSLCRDLAGRGVDVHGVITDPAAPTTTKIRVAAADQVLVRFDEQPPPPPGPGTVRDLLRLLESALGDADALVVADYGLGLLTDRVRDRLVALRDRVPLLVVDAHDCARWAPARPDLATPSVAEVLRLPGLVLPDGFPADGAQRLDAVERLAGELRRRSGAVRLAVTADRDGVVLLEPPSGDPPAAHRTRARQAADSRASGAGDAFTAAVTLAVAAGVDRRTAVDLAQAAADVVVAEPGPTVCDTAGLTAYLGGRSHQVIGLSGLEAAVRAHRAAGRRIVFTNGCFDVLHRAHVACLEEARRLGDVLVVAINSDASVRRLKGPGRPVNTAGDRAAVLAALACADHVTVFDQDTPVDLLRRLRPDVYVKGGDYSPQMLAETPVVESYGGQVRIVRYVPGHSTTAVIERIASGRGVVVDGGRPVGVPDGRP